MTELLGSTAAAMHTSDHLLALPAGVPVDELARAWFSGARWLRRPVSREDAAADAAPLRGARFRGMAEPEPRPGELSLEPGVTLAGPFDLTGPQTQFLDLPARRAVLYAVHVDDDVRVRAPGPGPDGDPDGLGHAFADGMATGAELRVVRWMVAAARLARGAVLVDGRTPAITPVAAGGVELRLFSAHHLTERQALALVRTVMVQVEPAASTRTLVGPQEYWLRGDTAYDGTLTVGVRRVDTLPQALAALPWREYGPFVYCVAWTPAASDDVRSDRGDQIARTRMLPIVARMLRTLHAAVEGTVVDEDGFVRPLGSLD